MKVTTLMKKVTYTHVDGDCDQHRFLEENLERFGEGMLYPLNKRQVALFYRSIVTDIASICAFQLGHLDKEDRSESSPVNDLPDLRGRKTNS